MDDYIIVKLSGKALGAQQELNALFKGLLNHKLILVHGGGVEVDALFKALDLKVEKKQGLRISPKEQMPYISAALSGMCSKTLQGLALANGHKALSLLASDGGMLQVSLLDKELGMVGKVEPGDSQLIKLLIENSYTPIIASLAFDEQGRLYNVNADDVAAALAQLLQAPLYLISDVPGVLDKNKQVIENLNGSMLESLIADGTITGGMAVKVKSALALAQKSQQQVYIGSYQEPQLIESLQRRQRLGTLLSI